MRVTEPRFRHRQPGTFVGHWDAHDIYGIFTGAEPPQVVIRYGDDVFDYEGKQSITLGSATFTASASGMTIEADSAAPGWGQFVEGIRSNWPGCEVQAHSGRGGVRLCIP